jgi:hypothetical protein
MVYRCNKYSLPLAPIVWWLAVTDCYWKNTCNSYIANIYFWQMLQYIIQNLFYIVLEIRPTSMQSSGEETCLLAMFYLLVNNIKFTKNISDSIVYVDTKQSMTDVLQRGLNAKLGNKSIRDVGFELFNSIPENQRNSYLEYLNPLLERLRKGLSPSESSNGVLKNSGMNAFLEYITLNKP